jgi:tetratricopeptide (TPR) repeat protein
MKNLILGLISFLLISTALQAQEADKELKKAGRALSAYNLDPTGNKGKLKEAVEHIQVAENAPETNTLAETWLTKGMIFNEIATQKIAVRQFGLGDGSDLPAVQHPEVEAFEAFKKALEFAQKKYETKDALKGLAAVQSSLYNFGIYDYEDQDYKGAYVAFKGVLEVHDLLTKNGEKSSLEAETDYNDQLYITGLAALNADMAKDAEPIFQKLYDSNFDKPAIFEALYKIKAEDDIEAAYKYLETGRKKFPDDISLLFAEINHYLRVGKLEVLITQLQEAINMEPNNVSLYSTLGNVYDNLYQKEYEAGNNEKAAEYFNSALSYYNQALEKEPKYFDAIYSIGALYYNKAAAMTKDLKVLEDDYSRDGIKKYEAKKKEIFDQFDMALPFFQKAEGLNPNDQSTLIALREIYARKNELELYEEFKVRLEKVQNNEMNESSYFKIEN